MNVYVSLETPDDPKAQTVRVLRSALPYAKEFTVEQVGAKIGEYRRCFMNNVVLPLTRDLFDGELLGAKERAPKDAHSWCLGIIRRFERYIYVS